MNKQSKKSIQLVSCDLNGTLVHQHTMMDMLRVYFPEQPERFEKAKGVFTKQTLGRLSMQEAFACAGPLTQGLSLRNAIRYTTTHMTFLDGFAEFISGLYERGIYFVINSTGYSVTTEAIKARYGAEKVHAVICNQLIFGWGGDTTKVVEESELSELVRDYFHGQERQARYDEILAIGEVVLGIQDEAQKAEKLFAIAERLNIPRHAIAHIGDTMGDSAGICEVARNGGLGVAFNYNQALKDYLEKVQAEGSLAGEIILLEPKKGTSSLKILLDILLSYSS